MGTLPMAEIEEEEEQPIKAERIDWSLIDTDSRREYYETQDRFMIIPHVVYHYIGPPVNRLFPSTDNLKQFCAEGIYFNENYFLELTWDEAEERYDAQLITPKIGNIFHVTYAPKFISKRFLTHNKYFGFKLTNSTNFVVYNKNYNFSQREAPEEIDISWLSDHVNLLNEDALDDRNIYSNVPNSQRPSKNLNGFHEQMNAFARNPESVLFDFLNNEETNEEILRMKGAWLAMKGKGKGKYKGKGFRQANPFNYYQFKGQYQKGNMYFKGSQKGQYEAQGKGPNYQTPKTTSSPFDEFKSKACFLIEDDTIYRYTEEKGLSKISIGETSLLKQSIKEIDTMMLILKDKKTLLKSKLKSSAKSLEDSDKDEEKPKSKGKPLKEKPKDSSSSEEDKPKPKHKVVKEKPKESSESSESEIIKMKTKKTKKKKKETDTVKSDESGTSEEEDEDRPPSKSKPKKKKKKKDK